MAVVQERRDVSGFDAVRLEGTGTVSIEQGEQDSLIIETEESLLPKIKSEVKNGRLEIGLRSWLDHLLEIGHAPVRYIITMRQVRELGISGSGRLETGPLTTDRLKIKVSGAGDLFIGPLQTPDLETSFSGSGKMQVSGAAQHLDVRISGAGDLRAEELDSQDVRVSISGSGRVSVRASQSLDVQISGSGDVRYQGQPTLRQHISGSGSVKQV